MQQDLSTIDNSFTKIIEEMRNEYLKALSLEIKEDEDVFICYSDITVWFYNRNCQNALPEIKKVWDTVETTKLGTKSL